MTAPRVALLFAGDVNRDARVGSTARALADLGSDVTVLGISADGQRHDSGVGSVKTIAVPVRWTRRDVRTSERARRRAWRPNGLSGTNPLSRATAQAWRLWSQLEDRMPVRSDWRTVLPEVLDIGESLGPTLRELAPEVVHVMDPLMGALAIQWVHDLRSDKFAVVLVADRARLSAKTPMERVAGPRGRAAWALLVDECLSVAVTTGDSGREASTAIEPPTPTKAPSESVALARPASVVLGIGPANSAGQAWAWANAVSRELPEVAHEVVSVATGTYDFPCDDSIPRAAYFDDSDWQRAMARKALTLWTHALFEAGRPIFGLLNGRDFRGDLAVLTDAGIECGLILHGSEVRDPRRHAATHEFSPFIDPHDPLTATLQRRVDALAPLLESRDFPMFVSTPDQLDDVPDATWLPVVVDTLALVPGEPPLQRDVPVVIHVPSRSSLKGTMGVEAVLREMSAQGRIYYRPVTGLAPADVPAMLRSADIVVDQLGMDLYGVLACEAMALGKVVVSQVGERVRSRVPVEVPIVEADPTSLAAVMDRVLGDRDWARGQASDGRRFVESIHDGRMSAGVLARFLGRSMGVGQ